MKTKITLLALLLCLCHFAQAQETDSTTFYRHSLGITVNPIYIEPFTAKHPIAYGLLYRYQHEKDKAIRVGVTVAYESRSYLTTHKDHPAPKDSLFTSKLIEFTAGYEWQHKFSRFFSLGYGIDVSAYLLRRHIEVDNILIGENVLLNEQFSSKYKTTGVNLQPFLNLNIDLSPRLYLVVECKASSGYSKEKYRAIGTYGDVNENPEDRGTLFGGAERNKFNSSLHPLSSIQLNFKL